MNKLLLIFALLIASCDTKDPIPCKSVSIQISDANPVQFWPVDCDTYNEKEVCGIHQKCWCQPWQCDDEIKVQFTEADPFASYFLVAFDSDYQLISSFDFSPTNLFKTESDIDFSNENFTSNITGWTNYVEASKKSWVYGTAGPFACAVSSGTTEPDSQILYATRSVNGIAGYNKFPPGTYRFRFNAHNNSSGGSGPLTESLVMRAFDVAGGANESNTLSGNARGGGFLDYEIELTTTQEWTYLSFAWEKDGTKTSSVINVLVNSIQIIENPLDYTTTVFNTSFVPSEEDICDQQIQLRITNEVHCNLENGDFDSTISPAFSEGVGNAWAWNAGAARVTLPSSVDQTQVFNIPFNASTGTTYDFELNVDVLLGAGSAGATTRIAILFTDGVSLTDIYDSGGLEVGNHVLTMSIPATSDWNSIQIIAAVMASSSYGRIVDINSIQCSDNIIEPLKSDCLDIATVQKCTELIEYSNNRNFAGLVYEADVSPEQTFNIRVPAIFFHNAFVEEDEAMELTTGITKTSGTLKVQRLFDTDYMPYYMHQKLILIFKHQSILIDALYWIKESAYEIQEGNRMWPVKKAKVLITENYIQRAVL